MSMLLKNERKIWFKKGVKKIKQKICGKVRKKVNVNVYINTDSY